MKDILEHDIEISIPDKCTVNAEIYAKYSLIFFRKLGIYIPIDKVYINHRGMKNEIFYRGFRDINIEGGSESGLFLDESIIEQFNEIVLTEDVYSNFNSTISYFLDNIDNYDIK